MARMMRLGEGWGHQCAVRLTPSRLRMTGVSVTRLRSSSEPAAICARSSGVSRSLPLVPAMALRARFMTLGSLRFRAVSTRILVTAALVAAAAATTPTEASAILTDRFMVRISFFQWDGAKNAA